MIIELTHYFNWRGSLLNPGQFISDLPDGLAENLVKAGNAKIWTPAKVKTDGQPDTERIQTDESANIPAGKTIPSGRVPAVVENARIETTEKVESFGRNTGIIQSGNGTAKPAGKPAGRKSAGATTGKAKATAKK